MSVEYAVALNWLRIRARRSNQWGSAAAELRGSCPISAAPAYFSSAAMRASNGGCVENRLLVREEIIMA